MRISRVPGAIVQSMPISVLMSVPNMGPLSPPLPPTWSRFDGEKSLSQSVQPVWPPWYHNFFRLVRHNPAAAGPSQCHDSIDIRSLTLPSAARNCRQRRAVMPQHQRGRPDVDRGRYTQWAQSRRVVVVADAEAAGRGLLPQHGDSRQDTVSFRGKRRWGTGHPPTRYQ